MLAIDLSPELEAILDRRAKEKGQAPAEYARLAIVQQLEDAEDIEDAEAAYAEYLADPSSARSIAMITVELGERVALIAKARGETEEHIIEEALTEGLFDLEAVSIAETRLAAIYSGEAKTLSHAEAFADGMES
jgi:predicted DNA-binding protein